MDHPVQAAKVDRDADVEAVLDKYEGLKLSSREEIDTFFVWPEDVRPDISHNKFDVEIPVIDLSPVLKLKRLKEEIAELKGGVKARDGIDKEIEACEATNVDVENAIRAACGTCGFFQITNHGFPIELVEQLTTHFGDIFDLPLEEKMKVTEEWYTDQHSKTGYTAMKRSTAYNKTGSNNAHIWNEGFDMEVPELAFPGRLEQLTETLWPEGSENSKKGRHLRSGVEEYGKQMNSLSYLLLDLMTASLGLPEKAMESLLGCSQDKQMYARIRINHYPVCTQPDLTWGIHSHTDSTVITVLHQDAVGGLQIGFEDRTWHGVRPIPGAFVVNVGDLLQAWTNGRFVSAEHRVVANDKHRRYSIAYFVLNQSDDLISPRPELVDAEHPRRYKSFTQKQYFETVLTAGLSKRRGQHLESVFRADTHP